MARDINYSICDFGFLSFTEKKETRQIVAVKGRGGMVPSGPLDFVGVGPTEPHNLRPGKEKKKKKRNELCLGFAIKREWVSECIYEKIWVEIYSPRKCSSDKRVVVERGDFKLQQYPWNFAFKIKLLKI